ncbi:MAG: hypothetical protein HY286_13640 [Planctomycetes bacterium]|nr:hypothetical protein [Planctomycetota bacterium]
MPAVQRHQLFTQPSQAEVLRLMGHREGSTILTDPMRRLLAEVESAGRQLLHIEAATARCDAPGEFGSGGIFKNAEKLVLGIVSIGAAIEEQAERFVKEGELARGMMLDAYGSAAVEAAAIELNYRICKYYERDGLAAGRRVSPGYPKWPIEQQKAIFDVFGGTAAGVEVNEYFIMIPRKSISFGVPLGRELDAASPELGCKYCSMRDCEYRRQPADADG